MINEETGSRLYDAINALRKDDIPYMLRCGISLRTTRLFQHKVYLFLEEGVHEWAYPFHLILFSILFGTIVLYIVDTFPNVNIPNELFFGLEIFLSVMFVVCFLLRMWACGFTPQYRNFRGRLRFGMTTFMLIDEISMVCTLVLVAFPNNPLFVPAVMLSSIRFLEIFRLLRKGKYEESTHLFISIQKNHDMKG